jgi:cysteine-rich repeat protein
VGAQCVGDCDGGGTVAINELIAGVTIALNANPVSSCEAFDANHDGTVSINELILAVNNALGMCPAGSTPTATTSAAGTPTPTPSGGTETPSQTPAVTPGCGNGVVEFDRGETCDDGNTVDGDNCPADCMIRDCQFTASTLDADVLVQGPADVLLGALQVFISYPDGVVALPSSGAQASIAISNLPDDAFSTSVNDLDYAVRVVTVGPDGLTLGTAPPNRFFTAQFTLCQGATGPSASDFQCTVENATSVGGDDVTANTTCSVALP